jgi:putative PIN family toxin of toxin-antitoxin system
MRILYDTNVLVGILSHRESILAFKNALQQDEIVHISSAYILSEVEVVLVEKLKLTKQKAKAAARLLGRQSVIVSPNKIDKICRDPFDDYVLAAAVAGKADYLVTADKDLLVLEKHKKVAIVTLNEFAATMKSHGQ